VVVFSVKAQSSLPSCTVEFFWESCTEKRVRPTVIADSFEVEGRLTLGIVGVFITYGWLSTISVIDPEIGLRNVMPSAG
jgi:hypothetical protein